MITTMTKETKKKGKEKKNEKIACGSFSSGS